MSQSLKRAFEAASKLPEPTQEQLAEYVLVLCQRAKAKLSPEEAHAIADAEAELARGGPVPQQQIDAFWRRHGL